MKGIILAGGNGSRLSPITKAVSKHLLPVYSKPMVYYSLSTLLLAGVREVLLVCRPQDKDAYKSLLGDGSRFGISLNYVLQNQPKGLTHGLLLGEGFTAGSQVMLALADNIFYGGGVGNSLKSIGEEKRGGATVFTQNVSNPTEYGILEIDDSGIPVNIEEKPENPISNLAVTGLYVYDETVFERAKTIRPSKRGEFEISELNNTYLVDRALHHVRLPRGTVWLDCGTVDSLSQASEFVKVIESRQGMMVSCPEEIAWKQGFITDTDLLALSVEEPNLHYGRYLENLLISTKDPGQGSKLRNGKPHGHPRFDV